MNWAHINVKGNDVHFRWLTQYAPDFWAEMKQRCDTLDRYAAEEKRLKAEKQAAKAA